MAPPAHNLERPRSVAAPSTAPHLAPFPWPRAIGFALGVLKLSPDAFWRMTPRELALAAEAVLGPAARPPGRSILADLMMRFPDGR